MDCDDAANWQAVTVDTAGIVGTNIAVAADGSGRVHVTHHSLFDSDLIYATCAVDCDAAANWQAVTVDAEGSVGA